MITKVKELDKNQAKSLYELWNCEYPVSLQFSTPQAFIDYLTQLEAPPTTCSKTKGKKL